MVSDSASPSDRRLQQFSLRTFFILMTVFAVWFGWAMNNAREQAKAVAWVREMGGSVRYEYEVDEDGGSTISPLGSVIGFGWGLVDGLIGGAVFAWLYNVILAYTSDSDGHETPA